MRTKEEYYGLVLKNRELAASPAITLSVAFSVDKK